MKNEKSLSSLNKSSFWLAAAALVAVVFAASLVWAPSGHAAPKPFSVEVKLKASKGFKAQLWGGNSMVAAGKQGAAVTFNKKGLSADFSVTNATVTKKKIKANFKGYGKVNLKFKPTKTSKIKVPKRCKGKAGKRIKGVWKGKINFKGDKKFSVVKMKQAKGSISYFPKIKSCKPFGEGDPDPVEIASASIGVSFPDAFAFATGERVNQPGSKASFFALHVSGEKKVSIYRSATLNKRPASSLAYNASAPYTVTFNPGKSPFQGSATIQSDTNVVTGSLKVKFPGLTFQMVRPGASGDFAIFESWGGGGLSLTNPIAVKSAQERVQAIAE